MHILLAIVGILGGLAFWWWRLKAMREAADDVTDAAGRAWGKWKRHKFRQKVDASPVEAVSDPAAAAVVMMLAIAETDGELTAATEAAIKSQITDAMGIEDPIELMVFAKWVAKHVEDADNVSLRYAKLWQQGLGQEERRDLADMVERVAGTDGPVSARQKAQIARLRERLGL